MLQAEYRELDTRARDGGEMEHYHHQLNSLLEEIEELSHAISVLNGRSSIPVGALVIYGSVIVLILMLMGMIWITRPL